ncbi:TolA protein [Pelomyxa schiedti]|nr:TolA protein [Pelomyxa schiedti]
MAAAKVTAAQMAKWKEITGKHYAGQAVWFLNGFWDEVERDAETIWGFVQKFGELDPEAHSAGQELDEFWSHKFLESLGETLTVVALREKLRQIDVDNNKKMSLCEYLLFRYKKSVDQLIRAPQGGNQAEMNKAQEMVDSAQAAVTEMMKKLEEQKPIVAQAQTAAAQAKSSAAEAKTKEAEAKETAEASAAAAAAADKAAAASRAAADESQAALSELQNQEEAVVKKKEALENTIKTGGLVARNKATNELEQLKSDDPLPLRRAKINQTASVKKAEKAAADAAAASQKASEAATAAAASARAAEAALAAAEEAKANAEARQAEVEEAERQTAAAAAEAEAKLEQATAYLHEVKQKSGAALGAMWWMEREITEKKKYLPKRRQ